MLVMMTPSSRAPPEVQVGDTRKSPDDQIFHIQHVRLSDTDGVPNSNNDIKMCNQPHFSLRGTSVYDGIIDTKVHF